MTREKLLLAAGCAALFAAVASAHSQPAPAPPSFKNLQVLPKDISRDQLTQTMKFFAQSLGVRCVHCHVGEEGKPLSTFDFASDAKRDKRVARAMLQMVHKINVEEFGVKDMKDAKVTCYTCHRGSTEPLTEVPPPAPAVPRTATERGGA